MTCDNGAEHSAAWALSLTFIFTHPSVISARKREVSALHGMVQMQALAHTFLKCMVSFAASQGLERDARP